jgi:hypothetical protein
MMAAKTTAGSRDVTAELAYLTRALKAPTLHLDRGPPRWIGRSLLVPGVRTLLGV